jgi:hypothetical protein
MRMEKTVIEALGAETLTGQEIADRTPYQFDGTFRQCLAGLRRRGILGGDRYTSGYWLTEQGRRLLGQDHAGDEGRPAPRPASVGAPSSRTFSEMEECVFKALESDTLTGQQIADRAGYPFDSALRACLAALRRRGILGGRPGDVGYCLTEEGRRLVSRGHEDEEDPSAPPPAPEPTGLSDTERQVLDALDKDTITGPQLAARLCWNFDRPFRELLHGMRRRGLLGGQAGQPYFATNG